MSENLVTLGGAFSEGYGIIPKKLMRSQDVSAYSKLILAYMLSYTGRGAECFPGIDTIRKDLKLSKSTIIRGIKELSDHKWIIKERMYPNNPLKHNNKYILSCVSEVSVVDHRGVTDEQTRLLEETSEVSTMDKNNNSINNNIINKKIRPSAYKHQYMDFVTLTTSEYFKLKAQFGRAGVRSRCEALNLWKGSKGKRTASDYLTILNWERMKKEDKTSQSVVPVRKPTVNIIEQVKADLAQDRR